jgi:hypothetical protein
LPELPLVSHGELQYANHHLYIPIDEALLAPLRNELGTSFPYSGIYLGEIDVQQKIEPVVIKDLWIAVLASQTKVISALARRRQKSFSTRQRSLNGPSSHSGFFA